MTLDYHPPSPEYRSTILGRLPLLLNIPAAIVIILYFSPLNPVKTGFVTAVAFDDWLFWSGLTCASGIPLGILPLFQRNTDLTAPLCGMMLNIFFAALFLPSLGY